MSNIIQPAEKADLGYAKPAHLSEVSLRAIIDASPRVTILLDSSFNVLECNPAACNLLRFESREALLSGFTQRVNEGVPKFLSNGRPTVSFVEMLMATITEGHLKFETEFYIGGAIRTLDVEMKKVPHGEDFAIVLYVIDVTETRDREKELMRSREQNELQLAKLNMAIKAAKISLWDMPYDRDDPVNPINRIEWSDELRQKLGFSDESDFPNLVSSLQHRMHPEDRDKSIDAFMIHLSDKTGKTPYDEEYRVKRKNGEYAFFRATGEAIRDSKGNPIRIAGAQIDITEAKNLLAEAEKQRIAAESANKAKSAFLSTMSHEIRTPMNAILGITEIQLMNDSIDPDIREAFEKIQTSGDLLLSIINDILDLSKIEAGKLELVIGKYDIASVVSDTAQLNMMRIGSKQIEFEIHIDENVPEHMSGDELRVKQILNNLLSNAFKYTAAGTVSMSVSVEDSNHCDEEVILVVSVSDTGQGMSKEQIDRLFDEYARFNKASNREKEGTGLGMSITKNLLHLMHGEISVESTLGKGSIFTVRLPQGKTSSIVIGKEMAENLCQFKTHSRAHMQRVQISRDPMPYGNILIVDDVETNIYVARGLMAPYELNIDSAYSGYAAIEKVRSGKEYDIIFMDHMMPELDGVETAKTLRKMGYSHPIVALTANAVVGQADIFLGNGFDDFISKPIDIRQLNQVLNKLIRDKQPPEVLEATNRRKMAAHKKAGESAPVDRRFFSEIFARDALKSLSVLEQIDRKGDYYSNDDLRTYLIHIHGMKSALANVGNMELSAAALKLEKFARDGNIEFVAVETPAFLSSLRAFAELIARDGEAENADAPDEADEDKQYLHEKLLIIQIACEQFDENAADEVLRELRSKSWSKPTKDFLSKISELLLHSDFDDIVSIIIDKRVRHIEKSCD